MGPILVDLMLLINKIHDYITFKSQMYFNLTDKQLHFIIMAVVGMVIFLTILPVFRYLAKKSIIAIAFIYSFTCLLVITFAIEIGQKITGGGHMEFADIASGLYGFLVVFVIYVFLVLIYRLIKVQINKHK